MTTRRYYSSDLTNREWAILEPLIPPPKSGGRPCRWERREIVDASLYVLRSGGIWRLLPHDFPPWQTVYHYFRLWRLDGTWERIHTALREQAGRRAGREATPSAAILDSQSVKTTEKGGRVATMAARRGKAASGTSWWTRRASSCSRSFTRLTWLIGTGASWCCSGSSPGKSGSHA